MGKKENKASQYLLMVMTRQIENTYNYQTSGRLSVENALGSENALHILFSSTGPELP